MSRRFSTRVDIVSELRFPPHWPPCGIESPTPRPLVPQPYSLCDTPKDTVFDVAEELSAGPRRWSQVYRGSLRSPSRVIYNDIVLKVYDESSFPTFPEYHISPLLGPDSWSSMPGPSKAMSYRYSGELMAWQESWAYSVLASAQGKFIPKFHGAYKVRLPQSPNGAVHFAIAVSFVDGPTIWDRFVQLGCAKDHGTPEGSIPPWYPLAREYIQRVYEIHQHGVAHFDPHHHNVKVVTSPSGVESLVFFDFATARPSRFPTREEEEQRSVPLVVCADKDSVTCAIGEMCGEAEDYVAAYKRRWKWVEWVKRTSANERWSKWFEDHAASIPQD